MVLRLVNISRFEHVAFRLNPQFVGFSCLFTLLFHSCLFAFQTVLSHFSAVTPRFSYFQVKAHENMLQLKLAPFQHHLRTVLVDLQDQDAGEIFQRPVSSKDVCYIFRYFSTIKSSIVMCFMDRDIFQFH